MVDTVRVTKSAGRSGVDDGLFLLLTGEAVEQDEGGVFLFAQDPEGAEFGRFSAEQEGSGVDQLAIDDSDVDRKVMTGQPPSPGRVRLRLTEKGEEITAGIAEGSCDVPEHRQVQFPEDVFVGHHLHHPGVGRDGHRLGDEAVCEHLLVSVECAQWKAVSPGFGQKVPVRAAEVLVRQEQPRSLLRGQAVEEPHRGERDQRRVE